jgi:hypothetical protein
MSETTGNRGPNGALTPFEKGKSGNPSGRPKTPPEIKEAFTKLVPRALQTLQEILSDPEARQGDKIRASEVILDRALGKAVQQIDANLTDKRPVNFPGGLEIGTKPQAD